MSLPHPGTHDATVDGFVLAGGNSSRMGQDKALIPLAGQPLIEHALAILRSAGLEPRIAGAKSDLSFFAPTVPDEPAHSGLGPLAGICSAIASGSAQHAVFLPIDLPLLPASLIEYLLHHALVTGAAATTVSVGDFVQTFPVVMDRASLPVLQSSLRSNDRNCLRAFRAAASALARPFSIQPIEMLVQPGQISHPRGYAAGDWFLNVNSPRELARAEILLAQKRHQVS